jgi:hypothetical protein
MDLKGFTLLLALGLTYVPVFGQSSPCNTQRVYQFLVERGSASKEDRGLVWCKPLLLDSNHDGVFSFGLNQTDSFTYFLTKRGNQFYFIKELKIDTVLGELSSYFKSSSFSFEQKAKCYTEVIKIMQEDLAATSHWSLPK